MKQLTGKALNSGSALGEAIVFHTTFSFIGDMSPATGEVTMARHEHFGKSLKNKVLVFQTGRGGTIAPFILYHAAKNGVAPCAILCDHADMLTLECALTVDIPIVHEFGGKITELVRDGDMLRVEGGTVTVAKSEKE